MISLTMYAFSTLISISLTETFSQSYVQNTVTIVTDAEFNDTGVVLSQPITCLLLLEYIHISFGANM